MFPTELELKLHFDELRAASAQYKLAQSLRETPTLWERLFARVRMSNSVQAQALGAARIAAKSDKETFNQAVCNASVVP